MENPEWYNPSMPPICALDIETTGLDPRNDAITEIGIVRFNGKRVEDKWTSLVNPGKPIPPEVTQLTGITNEMVTKAPPIKAVIQEMADFVGDSPVLGHNVRFDLGFLQKQKVLQLNEVLDTYEMAAVLIPTASRYALGMLGQQLGILLPNSHRALDDAQLTHAVYLKLYEKALALPIELLSEIIHLGENLDWDCNWILRQILKARIQQPLEAKKVFAFTPTDISSSVTQNSPLSPKETPEKLDEDELAAILEHGGLFSEFFPDFEQRPQQIEMLRSITHALSESHHFMVEAGTGTGKSYAYLIPAAFWAIKNGLRVVISTNTINLQEQLIHKDIPDVRDALKLDLRAAVLKGRVNYLCPRRLDIMRQRGVDSVEGVRVLGKTLVWLHQGGSGDRNEINLNGPDERAFWAGKLSADDEGCKNEICMGRMGGTCPFFKARMAAQNAHLVVVNHALLLADVVTSSRVLPDYQYLIVDEAHHLESATTNALSYRMTAFEFDRMIRELGSSSSGILGRLLSLLQGVLDPSDFASLDHQIHKITDLAFRVDQKFKKFLDSVSMYMEDQREGQPVGNYGHQERIQPATRTLPAWSEVEITWSDVEEPLAALLPSLKEIPRSIIDLYKSVPDDLADVIGNLGSLIMRFSEMDTRLHGLVTEPDPQMIYWVEVQPNFDRLILQIAPLHIGSMMEQYLWNDKQSVILTSATLTTHNTFDYLRSRLSAETSDELQLGSPFDYETSAMLYLVDDIAEPADVSRFQYDIEKTLVRLAKATGGRMLVLFTSYAQLRKTSIKIAPHLAESEIQVFEQGEGASASTLLETFKDTDQAVLLGTRAFWEGVDIAGDALSVLVIVKLPFDVPTDPIVAARSETFEDPFNEYNIPEAILRFRQGFGRLIRTQSDRGIVVVLDKRLLSKKYGKLFLESLPDCTKKIGHLDSLPETARRWLNL